MISFINKLSLIKGSKAVGLNIWIGPEDELEFNVGHICKSRNKLTIIDKRKFSSLEEFSATISRKLPVYLSVDGKGILHKIIDIEPDILLIERLLPGADAQKFILQSIPIHEKRKLLSLIRRDKLEDLLASLSCSGFEILKVFLGPFSLVSFIQLVEDNSIIHIPYYKLTIYDNCIKDFEKNVDSCKDLNITIDSEVLSSDSIVPFSNGVHHFLDDPSIFFDYPEINLNKENFLYKRLFKSASLGLMIVFFSCLMINFLIFNHYRHENQLLDNQIDSNKEILNKIEKLKQLIKTREEFFNNNSNNTKIPFAYYTDRISKKVPDGITLTQMNLFPIQKQTTNQESFYFQSGKILISGYTQSATYLYTWIEAMKSYNWIFDISIKNYIDNGIELAKFELVINLSENKK